MESGETRGQDGRVRTNEQGRSQADVERVKEKATEAAQDLKQTGKERAEQTKHTAASQVEQLADVAGDVAARLDSQNPSLAGYASELASSMNRLANDLRHRSIDDLVAQTQNIARSNPTMFLMGSIALGVTLSRFMKASSERDRDRERQRDFAREPERADGYTYKPPIGTATGEPIVTPPGAAPGELH